MATRLLLPLLLLAACGACQAAYVSGVYWLEEDIYCLDVTVHNNEPGDEWYVTGFNVRPGAFDAQAPPRWYVGWSQWHVSWGASSHEYGVPPGEELYGFTFQTYDMADEYSYKMWSWQGDYWAGHFTPEYIPWPPATGAAALAILGLWAARRLRRP